MDNGKRKAENGAKKIEEKNKREGRPGHGAHPNTRYQVAFRIIAPTPCIYSVLEP